MTRDKFTEFLEREGRHYNDPPPPPREEMWARIQELRARNRFQRVHPRPWIRIAGGVAALLVIGIGIGRWTARTPVSTLDAGSELAADAETDARVFRVAAIDHLDQLDTFIALFRADATTGTTDPAMATWTRELLSTTRLMLDSPAGEDLALRQLLEDLELVLAQIAEYAEQRDQTELDLIEEDLAERDLLLRLRAELAISDPTRPTRGEI